MFNYEAKPEQFLTLGYPAWTGGKCARLQRPGNKMKGNKGVLVGKTTKQLERPSTHKPLFSSSAHPALLFTQPRRSLGLSAGLEGTELQSTTAAHASAMESCLEL